MCKKILFLLILMSVSYLFSREIKSKETISYQDFDDLFVSSKLNSNFKINEELYGVFTEESFVVINLKNKSNKTIMKVGKGPGECLQPTSLIEFNGKFICLDIKKNSLIIFDSDFNFLTEHKLEITPVSIVKWNEDKFVVINSFLGDGLLVDIYNSDLKIEKSVFDSKEIDDSISGYEKYFLYNFAKFIVQNDKLYFFIQGKPKYQATNLITGDTSIIDYSKKLSFHYKKIKTEKNGMVNMNFYIHSLNKGSNNNLILGLSNNISDDEINAYIYDFNINSDKFEEVKIPNYELGSYRRIIEEDRIIEFDNDEEKIIIYEVI